MNQQAYGRLLHSALESAKKIAANVRAKVVASTVIRATENMPAHEFPARPGKNLLPCSNSHSPFRVIIIKGTEPSPPLVTHHER